MKRSSSSTSSSDTNDRALLRIAGVVALTVLFVLVLDLAINVLFSMPDDPLVQPSRLQQYFNYGRSIEGKLRYMVRDTDEASAPIVRSGWFDAQDPGPAVREQSDGRLIAIYGHSMSHRVGHVIAALDPRVTLRLLGGPAAPLGHSYELFRRDRGLHEADIVLLGVVASGLSALTTMTGMCWGFEAPAPYTYPRWYLEGGELKSIQPTITSLQGLREALGNSDRWEEFVEQLATHDLSFSPDLFHEGLLDRSALMRALRRGLGQRAQDRFSDRFADQSVLPEHENVAAIARAIITRFGSEAREDGAIPVVLLFHDRGTGDTLYRTLVDTLTQNDILFMSTHEIAPASDTRSFLRDGHFRQDLDAVFAKRVLDIIELRRSL